MSKTNPKEPDLFQQLIALITGSSLVLVFGILLALIYLPFEKSISKTFQAKPSVEFTNSSGSSTESEIDPEKVVDGIHVATGMVYDANFSIVRGACTSCHSAKLVTQNRATRDGWKQMIIWMQATQGLQDLGEYEVKILDYLEKNYSPLDVGRRKGLDQASIDWYTLDQSEQR